MDDETSQDGDTVLKHGRSAKSLASVGRQLSLSVWAEGILGGNSGADGTTQTHSDPGFVLQTQVSGQSERKDRVNPDDVSRAERS
eukprot:8519864-Pyramimonas_sp.AAC.1